MTKKEIDDIVKDKEFVGIEFKNMPMLTFTGTYAFLIGKKGKVLGVNNYYPEYTNINFNGNHYHYPTDLVVKQIQENEKPIDENLLFTEVYKILTIICKI